MINAELTVELETHASNQCSDAGRPVTRAWRLRAKHQVYVGVCEWAPANWGTRAGHTNLLLNWERDDGAHARASAAGRDSDPSRAGFSAGRGAAQYHAPGVARRAARGGLLRTLHGLHRPRRLARAFDELGAELGANRARGRALSGVRSDGFERRGAATHRSCGWGARAADLDRGRGQPDVGRPCRRVDDHRPAASG